MFLLFFFTFVFYLVFVANSNCSLSINIWHMQQLHINMNAFKSVEYGQCGQTPNWCIHTTHIHIHIHKYIYIYINPYCVQCECISVYYVCIAVGWLVLLKLLKLLCFGNACERPNINAPCIKWKCNHTYVYMHWIGVVNVWNIARVLCLRPNQVPCIVW